MILLPGSKIQLLFLLYVIYQPTWPRNAAIAYS